MFTGQISQGDTPDRADAGRESTPPSTDIAPTTTRGLTPTQGVRLVREQRLEVVTRTRGSDTIVLDAGIHADLELVMCGLTRHSLPLREHAWTSYQQGIKGIKGAKRVKNAKGVKGIKAKSPGPSCCCEAAQPQQCDFRTRGRCEADGDLWTVGAHCPTD